jgi:hypothetical protein
MLAALACALTIFGVPAPAQQLPAKPWVVVVPGSVNSLLASFLECVGHYQKQGFSINRAIAQCVVNEATRTGMGGSLSASFVSGASELGASAVQCSTLRVDPRAAGIVHRPLDPTHVDGSPLPGKPGSFDNTWAAIWHLVDMLSVEFAREGEALRAQASETSDPVQKQVLNDKADAMNELSGIMFDRETADWYATAIQAYQDYLEKNPPSPPGDYPLPSPDEPQPSKVDPEGVSVCQNVTQLVNECSLAGWQTSPCQMFLARLNGCGDPKITDPAPDGAQECRAPRVRKEEAQRVAYHACSIKTTPGPDADPCSGPVVEGLAFTFAFGRNDPNRPICSNVFAYTTSEECTSTFTVTVGPQAGADSVIAEAQKRLGGPIFVRPVPSPLDP